MMMARFRSAAIWANLPKASAAAELSFQRYAPHQGHERIDEKQIRLEAIKFASKKIPIGLMQQRLSTLGPEQREPKAINTCNMQPRNVCIRQRMVGHGRAGPKADLVGRVLSIDVEDAQLATEDVATEEWLAGRASER